MSQSTVDKKLTLIEWKMLKYLLTPFRAGGGPALPSFKIGPRDVYLHPGDNVTADAKAALRSIALRGWTDTDSYVNHRANEKGRAALSAHPDKPMWSPPAPPKLHERDFEVLGSLEGMVRCCGTVWGTPLLCGGGSGSYHSASLVKLVQHGYASCRQRHGTVETTGAGIVSEPHIFRKSKGSREFKITDAGIAALADYEQGRRARREG